jgi:hypothetical protein
MLTTFAHVKWFVDEEPQPVAALTGNEWLMVGLGIVGGTVLLLAVQFFN